MIVSTITQSIEDREAHPSRKTHEEILARICGLTAGIRDGAAAAEEARTVPREAIDALLINRP